MSVPKLLTMLDNVPCSPPDDEHNKNCGSHTDTAAATHCATTSRINAGDDSLHSLVQRRFTLQLNAELEPNERVGLTGDVKSLGDWKPRCAVELQTHDNKLQWATDVWLPKRITISYRYFIYIEDRQGHKLIKRWEANLKPRVHHLNNKETVDRIGETFVNADNDTQQQNQQIKRGWLTNEWIVQLKFEREKIFQVIDIDKFDPENVLIKIVPLKEDESEWDPLSLGITIEVVKLQYGQSRLESQKSFGISHSYGDIIIFHLTIFPSPILCGFLALIFYTPERKPMGRCLININELMGSEGVLNLTVTDYPLPSSSDSKLPIAQVTLPYLIVRPFKEATLDFRTTYAHYWPKSWPVLDVGHRGNGRSFLVNPPAQRENTLASFRYAHEHFADMVELDVHLTADNVPIIYHDFGVRTAPQGKVITSPTQLQFVLIKDLSYEAVKRLRVFAIINNEIVEYPGYNAEPRVEHRIFPTLSDVLQGLPKALGINVEIKWPQLEINGGIESSQTIDKNLFVDCILTTVINEGCGRPLIFSSFDADICTMLRFKQNLLPIMFLTQGITTKWEAHLELRTHNFMQAVNNAQAFELAGTAAHAEEFLGKNGAQLIKNARELGQIVLIWGDDCNSVQRVQHFREIGATAVCYDRTDLFMPKGKQRAFFNSSNLFADFEEHCKN